MLTLYSFGPAFGLPDASPFVMKAEVLLKMAALPYRIDTSGFRGAPKGKLPYLQDGAEIVADSTFIRWHLERRHGIDFDLGLSAAERATAWAFEKMAEEHLYWAFLYSRWIEAEHFAKVKAALFGRIGWPARLLVPPMVQRKVRRNLKAHGLGRHSREEIYALGARDLEAIADFLGAKPFLMGAEPVGADATIFAFAAGALCPAFETPLRAAALKHANLVAYEERMRQRFYPEAAAAPRAA